MIRSNPLRQLPEFVDIIRRNADFFTTSGNDYHVCRLTLKQDFLNSGTVTEPVSMPGLTFILMNRGEVEIELNTSLYTLSQGNMLVTDSRFLQKLKSIRTPEAVMHILSLTPEFIRNLNIDINVLQKTRLRTSSEPVIIDVTPETEILTGYMNMLNDNALTNVPNSIYTKNISRSLIAALIYQLMQIGDRNYVTDVSSRMATDSARSASARRMNYVKAFMELIHENYATERSLGFYADKLCISPKYLSAIIKECTNRSAAEWIDEYVMIEAKNMLRFSGMNIQQVAYALNFRNQSAFGKYFKNLTGMSPSQFQKS